MSIILKKVCPFCKASFQRYTAVRRHICNAHNKIVKSRRKGKPVEAKELNGDNRNKNGVFYGCPSCNNYFEKKYMLKEHVEALHIIRYTRKHYKNERVSYKQLTWLLCWQDI